MAGLKSDYDSVFVEEWSPYLGGILLLMVIIALMLSGLFWGIFSGLRLWGDWFNNFIHLGPLIGVSRHLDGPFMHHMSLMNITLVLGAFCAALLSRQFHVNFPPRQEYVWAIAGGCLMGLGSSLAGGCTTGGFFTPILHSSPAGWVMGAGLGIGSYIGLKLLLWSMDHISWGTKPPRVILVSPRVHAYYPLIGLGVLALILAWASLWYLGSNAKLVSRAVVILAGFAIGFIMHRSRLCFARAFREPFMTAEGQMTKAIILTLLIGIPLASLLFQHKVIDDPYIAIPPTFWIGSLLGGMIFGIGMVFAGGCASGSLWRMGEGNIKLWVVIFFFSWTGSIASALLKKFQFTSIDENNVEPYEKTALGIQAYFPAMLDGWGWTFVISILFLSIWYLLVRYNESTVKFTIF